MQRIHWHLIQYDISDPGRLRRVYRLLKSCALSLQNSVFVWSGTDSELLSLQQRLTAIIDRNLDDIRGYRVDNPLLIFGRSPFLIDCHFNNMPPHQHCPAEWLLQPPAGLFSQ